MIESCMVSVAAGCEGLFTLEEGHGWLALKKSGIGVLDGAADHHPAAALLLKILEVSLWHAPWVGVDVDGLIRETRTDAIESLGASESHLTDRHRNTKSVTGMAGR
eukprot:scaffold64956_cov29-Prasinocladus_malaysianus.AAC.1